MKHLIESPKLQVISGSILDIDALDPLIRNSQYVFHLAAAVGVFNIVNHPLVSLRTNIRGTENVLELCDKYCRPVFLTSSSEIYGKNDSDALGEEDDRVIGAPSKLRWTYSEAKAIDEALAFSYYFEKNLEVRIVRFFNTVGPRQLGSYGMVLPRMIKSAKADQDIEIYGDGNQTRCFIHVLDVIDAVISVAFASNTIGKAINVGNNHEISINDLANYIVRNLNSKSKIVHIPYHEVYGSGFEDMKRRVPNIDLINSLVGWKPARNLDKIIVDISSSL